MKYILINQNGINRKIVDISLGGINHANYPDYCDVYVESAAWDDSGEELTEDELESIPFESVYEYLMDNLY